MLTRSDLSDELKTTLIDEYSAERIPDDGEFYRKIRGYQQERSPQFEKQWWARLNDVSPSKKSKLERLFRNPDWKAAFDLVLDIPALDDGIEIGNLHTIIGMRCEEVSRFQLCIFVANNFRSHNSAIWII
jgi:Protein of unknown function (DUF3723)